MRFFETEISEYYALIAAEDEQQAMRTYYEEVADDDPQFKEVEEEYAMRKFISGMERTYGDGTRWSEGEKVFHDLASDDEPSLLLIDGALA